MKTFFPALAIIAAASLTFQSCSDDSKSAPQNDGQVTFTIAVPDAVQSRAYADGTTAQQNLNYYVYDQANAASPVLSGKVPMADLKGSITLSLATAHTYDVVFLATATDSPYTYDEGARTMTVDYTAAATNAENLDAFYATVHDLAVTGPSSQSVKLYRPFAQLNIGTDDKAEYEAITHTTIATSSVTVTGLYSTFDLMTEDVAGATTDVTFLAAALPGVGETFPVKYTNEAGAEIPYTYLSMDYLLVNQTKDIVDVTLSLTNADATTEVREYSNIPVQRNYRTNIYGTLLTASTLFNVEIVPGFEKPDYDICPTVTTPEDLLQAIQAFGGATIPEGVTINTDELFPTESDSWIITEPTTIVLDGDITNDTGGQIHVQGELTIKGKGELTSSVRGLIWLEEGGKLDMSDVTVNTPSNTRGSGIYITGGEAIIENTTFNSGYTTISVDPGSKAKVSVKNCTVNNTSSNQYKNWSYALNFKGGEATLENITASGIQGCVSAGRDAKVTILSGSYSTHNSEGKTDAFGALYVTGDAVVTIYGGSFYSPRKNYAALCGDNDVNTPYGNIILFGGTFSDKPWDSNTDRKCVIEPAEGYEYVETGDATHPWKVVKK